jgi:hypothetical protein
MKLNRYRGVWERMRESMMTDTLGHERMGLDEMEGEEANTQS